MKIKTTILSILAIAVLAGCGKKDLHTPSGSGTDESEVAYISIRIDNQPMTRYSGENDGLNESDIKSLYLFTFDDDNVIVGVPGTTDYYIPIDPATATPDPVRISSRATKLLVIANPGTELTKVFGTLNGTTVFHTMNQAVKNVTHAEITDNVNSVTKGFTMINSGDETGKSAGDKIDQPLIGIADKIKKVDENQSETEAQAEAKKDRVEVKVERLASKLAMKLKTPVDAKGASFAFQKWTIDAVNTTFYPFAEKTLLSVVNNATDPFYSFNFYTKDPNFTGTVGVGLSKATIDADYSPKLVDPYTWMDAGDEVYGVENTMAAGEQKFGNATRLVIRGTYYPSGFTASGDWFSFAGKDYKDLDELKTAYDEAGAGSNLQTACNDFYSKVYTYLDAKSEDLTGINGFKDLTPTLLLKVGNGGQVVKNGKTPVIRWYQNGLNYWYYEIRHDNETADDMVLGKYGIVRNNWYSLTLGTVNGAGTPWYPETDNPGPGDPDPTDPIDETPGYLGITVEVAPWIIWDTEFEI